MLLLNYAEPSEPNNTMDQFLDKNVNSNNNNTNNKNNANNNNESNSPNTLSPLSSANPSNPTPDSSNGHDAHVQSISPSHSQSHSHSHSHSLQPPQQQQQQYQQQQILIPISHTAAHNQFNFHPAHAHMHPMTTTGTTQTMQPQTHPGHPHPHHQFVSMPMQSVNMQQQLLFNANNQHSQPVIIRLVPTLNTMYNSQTNAMNIPPLPPCFATATATTNQPHTATTSPTTNQNNQNSPNRLAATLSPFNFTQIPQIPLIVNNANNATSFVAAQTPTLYTPQNNKVNAFHTMNMISTAAQNQPHLPPYIPPLPTSPNNSKKFTATTNTRKRSISDFKNDGLKQEKAMDDDANSLKKRKLSPPMLPRIGTNSSSNRQSTKFKLAMDLLDNFRAEHGGKLPSLRAIMKMLKVGFPKAHEILDEYAKHIGCSKEKLVQNMTVRQQKKNVNDIKIIYNDNNDDTD